MILFYISHCSFVYSRLGHSCYHPEGRLEGPESALHRHCPQAVLCAPLVPAAGPLEELAAPLACPAAVGDGLADDVPDDVRAAPLLPEADHRE